MTYIALQRSLVLAAVAAIANLSPARAQQPAPIDTAVVDSIIRRHVAEKRITGVSVGIMQHGAIVFARGYGTADLETGRPVTTRTMFAIGSVTKQFTCSALLMLQEEGKLSLNDPVSKYFP
jgi:D-alanyl-D-alanine carboxypeptidase